MPSLEISLGQAWAKGLKIVFANKEKSQATSLENSFHLKQVHGNTLVKVEEKDRPGHEPFALGDGLYIHGDWFKNSRSTLVIKTADCIPLFYVDEKNKRIAALHAGWRGLRQGILEKPFTEGGFVPDQCWVWMGPSLNGKNFEVGPDMWQLFPEAGDKRFFRPVPEKPEKRYFYPWVFVKEALEKKGVPLVYNVEVDTFEDEDFFSYRRGKGASDRNLSWIGFT